MSNKFQSQLFVIKGKGTRPIQQFAKQGLRKALAQDGIRTSLLHNSEISAPQKQYTKGHRSRAPQGNLRPLHSYLRSRKISPNYF